jgi:hypothetical protein
MPWPPSQHLQYQDLSTETIWQFSFECGLCHQEIETKTFPKEALEPETVRETYLQESLDVLLRFCPKCSEWVCREQCWEPIQCTCEGCCTSIAQMNFEPMSKEGAPQSTFLENDLKTGRLYSSILGTSCANCNATVSQNQINCPDCGQPLT